jgi:predicted unusual protein kinase regulating ubiquinone biosynthesis (AarF/ABC1/UbiB family)
MDPEKNRLSRRMRRYARVGTGVGGVAARYAGQRFLGIGGDRESNAAALAAALGGLKGPLMKVAQMLATIPDAVPAEYATALRQLQSQAPAMGWPFVKRRMAAELGPGWRDRFAEFGHEAAASASLGQVHKARGLDGRDLACKLQYPDMDSAVEADLKQLELIFAIHRRMEPAIDTRHISEEIGSRLREELDYTREAQHMRLYAGMLNDVGEVRVPGVVRELSTRRLLTMDWLEGRGVLDYVDAELAVRNVIAAAMFRAWWHPFSHFGVIHGDPHLGNYTAFEEAGTPAGINLLDYGCIRIFRPPFVGGVVDLYHGLQKDDRDRIVHAYETWGFSGLGNDLIDVLNIWARFIYAPLLDDRVRTVADGVSPAEYGRKQAFQVHRALREPHLDALRRE